VQHFLLLRDDSLHITEIKEENLGLPQDYFIKSHRAERKRVKVIPIYGKISICNLILLFMKKI
jgi:hypothetical protein